jgi:hypothetical protein
MREKAYLHLTDRVPFNIPENPGHQPVIPDGVAADIHEQLIDLHNREQAHFIEYRTVESSKPPVQSHQPRLVHHT